VPTSAAVGMSGVQLLASCIGWAHRAQGLVSISAKSTLSGKFLRRRSGMTSTLIGLSRVSVSTTSWGTIRTPLWSA